MSFATARYAVVPVIPLIKGIEKSEQKGDFFKTKIYPGNEHDATKAHDITIRHFSTGSAEEWIKGYIAFSDIVEWQKPGNLFTLARIWLKGDALSKFNTICQELGIPFNFVEQETKKNFYEVANKLSVLLMPRDSLSTQKEYMVYYCRKPADMKFRAYVTRLCELNDFLLHFPPNFHESQKFSKQQLIDIVNYGMPPKWKLKLATDYGTVSKDSITLELLMDFGERQEMQESFASTNSASFASKPIPRKVGSTYKKEYVPGSLTKIGYANANKPAGAQKKWCPYHKTNSHGIAECTVVQKLAESAAASRESKPAANPGKFDKKTFQNFIMFNKWQERKQAAMMLMEAEPEEEPTEEVMDDNEAEVPVESGEEIDLDDISLSDMQDME